MPVPAGMRRPTMTFSFRPRRWSTLPEMDASVSTRVVSWNDAAEMNESVESDAFVIPSSSGRPCAGRPPSASTRSFSSRKRNLSTCSSTRNSVSPTSSILTHRIICRAMVSMCLSLMLTPWRLGQNDDLPLPLDDAAVLDDAVDFGDDGGLARLARLEQLHHARQTARDVLRLGRL